MSKGILLEVERRQAVVLTPRGEFKRIRLPEGAWQIGDEVSFAERRQLPWARWGWMAAAAALLLLALPTGYQSWMLAQPATMLTVDINPSLRLTLNVQDQVITAEGLNADGSLVLTGVEWKRRTVEEVLAGVTARAVETGKLDLTDSGSAVVVALAPAAGKELAAERSEALLSRSKEAVRTKVAEKAREMRVEPSVGVAALEATAGERDEAEAGGLTPGRLLLLREIQTRVPGITAEQVKEEGPGRLLKRLNLSPSEIFAQAEERRGPERSEKKRQEPSEKKWQEPSEKKWQEPSEKKRQEPSEKKRQESDRPAPGGAEPASGGEKPGKDKDKPGRKNKP